jgi:hypothetical protein
MEKRLDRVGSWVLLPLGLLAGTALGCGGGETGETPPPDGQVTWHQDVAPLVAKHCFSCHVAGGIGPFSLADYSSAKGVAGLMLDEVQAGTMPPWSAVETDECKPRFGFEHDPRLSTAEIDTLKKWVEAGTPEGDPATAAPLPEADSIAIQDPSADLPFPAAFTVDGDSDLFQCFVIDPGNTDKMWITEIQLTPGNSRVAHHGLVFLDFSGESEALATNGQFPCFNNPDVPGYLLATWVPGAMPVVTPQGAGMPVFPGSRIVVQMHYHPTGTGPEEDLSTVQLKWTGTEPKYEAAQALIGNFKDLEDDGSGLQLGPNDADPAVPEFRIPANMSGHVEKMVYRQDIPLGIPIYSVGTHMHYVGTDMKIDLVDSTGESECLLQTPKWDFNWQRVYAYRAAIEELPVVGPSDELHMRCTYDNTLDNPFVARALKEKGLTQPTDVLLGEETLDEMCLGIFGILVAPGVLEQIFQ